MKSIAFVDIHKIKDDTSIQCRVSIDEHNIADCMESLDDTPPIRLYKEIENGEVVYYIGDGWHRKIAHERAGKLIVRAHVFEGGKDAAVTYAVQANGPKEHGVKRTQADKQKAITVYLTYKDWYLHSDPRVAKACAVSHPTVASARLSLERAGTIPVAQERLGLDGKMQSSTQQKQGVNLHPESEAPQPLRSVSKPEERTGSSYFDDLIAKGKERKPAPKCQHDTCYRLAYDGVHCTEHMPKETLPAGVVNPSHSSSNEEAKPEETGVQCGAIQEVSEQGLSAAKGEPLILRDPRKGGDQEVGRDVSPGEADQGDPPKEPTPARAGSGEIAEAVDAALAKAGLLCPKHALPVTECKLMACPYVKGLGAPAFKGNGERYQHYNTPPLLADPLRRVAPIGLDPCHNPGSILGARVTLDESQNGLSEDHDWEDLAEGDLIVVNPPYNNIAPWAERCALEAAKGAIVVLIVPNRGETDWWQRAAESSNLIITIRGRVAFLKDGVPDPNPTEGTVLFFWGNFGMRRLAAAFSPLGHPSQTFGKSWYEQEAKQLREEALQEKQLGLPPSGNPQSEALPTPPKADPTWKKETYLAELKACNSITEGASVCVKWEKAAFGDTARVREIQVLYQEWRQTKPATKPYNHQPKAPAPKRNKGKDESHLLPGEKIDPKLLKPKKEKDEPIRGTIKKGRGK